MEKKRRRLVNWLRNVPYPGTKHQNRQANEKPDEAELRRTPAPAARVHRHRRGQPGAGEHERAADHSADAVSGRVRRGPPHQEQHGQHSEDLAADSDQAAHRAHGLPAPEQPDRVLVHGGLCAALLPGHQGRVRQHVRAADHERPVHGLDARRRAADALQVARAPLAARGLRAAARPRRLPRPAHPEAGVHHFAEDVAGAEAAVLGVHGGHWRDERQ